MSFISSASIRSSQQLGERVSISSNPLPTENEISHVSAEKRNNKIEDDPELECEEDDPQFVAKSKKQVKFVLSDF